MPKKRHALYISIILMSTMFSCHSLWLNSKLANLFSSIGSGLLASSILAYVIDIGNFKEEQKKLEQIMKDILIPTQETLKCFIYGFAFSCYRVDKNISMTLTMNMKAWIRRLITIYRQNNIDITNSNISLGASCNNLVNRIDELRKNRIVLLRYGVLTNDIYYPLCAISFYAEQCKNSINSKSREGTAEALDFFLKQTDDAFTAIDQWCTYSKNYSINDSINTIYSSSYKTWFKE